MPGQLAAKLAALGFTAHWPLGEAAGDALDAIGSNDGTVTIAAGVRDVTPLNDRGDGCITFDGVATAIEVTAAAAIEDVWDGGGSVFFMFRANSDGGGNFGRIFDNGVTRIFVLFEAGGFIAIKIIVDWSTDDLGFETAVNLALGATIIGVITYDADLAANTPIFILHDGTAQTTRIDGAGLTRSPGPAPSGTRTSDAAANLFIGNRASATRSFDGEVDETAYANGVTLSVADATALIDLARREIGADPQFLDFPASPGIAVRQQVIST